MNSVETTQVPLVMVPERSVALMPPRGPGAVTHFSSLRLHPVPYFRWECENTIKYVVLVSLSAPWCHLSDRGHLTHDDGTHRKRGLQNPLAPRRLTTRVTKPAKTFGHTSRSVDKAPVHTYLLVLRTYVCMCDICMFCYASIIRQCSLLYIRE